ncbi:hypothetical protein SAMN05661091_5827 [Paenibacillus uliginis N3/975]|uniref:Uncharacterized protein n=1 Tax=Paenibacillus uliginis N3/975 TaxID=1313296 RepID=A0A1X7HTY0_9BACL|nr:hypothetical protein [Paenibacillus uliginis]SMF92445.1 hypothetical protein SAMN05661091_5827 [Paenibacillus uliginis N3/975]
MDLNVNKWLILHLCSNIILLFLSVGLFAMHHARFEPSGFGFLYFVTILCFAGFVVIIITDLVTSATRQIHGQIVHKQGRTIHVSRNDGNLKKYRVFVPEVLHKLEQGQFVNISLTRLAHVPSSIAIVDPPGENESFLQAR